MTTFTNRARTDEPGVTGVEPGASRSSAHARLGSSRPTIMRSRKMETEFTPVGSDVGRTATICKGSSGSWGLQLAERAGGLVVAGVDADSDAHSAGLEAGLLLLEIRPITLASRRAPPAVLGMLMTPLLPMTAWKERRTTCAGCDFGSSCRS